MTLQWPSYVRLVQNNLFPIWRGLSSCRSYPVATPDHHPWSSIVTAAWIEYEAQRTQAVKEHQWNSITEFLG
jgi:hypothetical protein